MQRTDTHINPDGVAIILEWTDSLSLQIQQMLMPLHLAKYGDT